MNSTLEALAYLDRATQACREIENMTAGQSELHAIRKLAEFARRRCEDATAELELDREPLVLT